MNVLYTNKCEKIAYQIHRNKELRRQTACKEKYIILYPRNIKHRNTQTRKEVKSIDGPGGLNCSWHDLKKQRLPS